MPTSRFRMRAWMAVLSIAGTLGGCGSDGSPRLDAAVQTDAAPTGDAGHARTDAAADASAELDARAGEDAARTDAAIEEIPIDVCVGGDCGQLPKAKRLVHAAGRDCEHAPGNSFAMQWRKRLTSSTCKPAGGCALTTTGGFAAADGTFWVLASLRSDTRAGLWLGRFSSGGKLLNEDMIERRVAPADTEYRFIGQIEATAGGATVLVHEETGLVPAPRSTMSNWLVFDAASETRRRIALQSKVAHAFFNLASQEDGTTWLLHAPHAKSTTSVMSFASDGTLRWLRNQLPWTALSIASSSGAIVIGGARDSRIDDQPCASLTKLDDDGRVVWDIELEHSTSSGLVSDAGGRLLHVSLRGASDDDDAGASAQPVSHFERITAAGTSEWVVRLDAELAGPNPFDADGNAYAVTGSLWDNDPMSLFTISADGTACSQHAVTKSEPPDGASPGRAFFHPASEGVVYFNDGDVIGALK